MEILLNLVWLCVSFALIAWWLQALRHGDSHPRWPVLIALCLLLLLLFPVISITDDLVAIAFPAETEHALRRHDATPPVSLALPASLTLLSFAVLGSVIAMFAFGRTHRPTFAAKLRGRFVRGLGLRPPPTRVSACA